MAFLAPAVPALVSSAVSVGGSLLANKLSGGGKATSGLSRGGIANINAGGLRSNSGTVKPTAERLGLVSSIASTFPEQASLIKGLRDQVLPGFSALKRARLDEIEKARRSSVGNLRENLARRRVLGSSFGQDAITRANAEFDQLAEKAAAESFLQSLDMTNKLINQEFDTRRGEFQTGLDEMNLEANLATQLASGATAQLGANARLKAELDAKAAQGAGSFFGTAIQPAAQALGSAIGQRFFPMGDVGMGSWAPTVTVG